MNNLDKQVFDAIYMFLTLDPILFMFNHSVMVGIVSGVISLIPFPKIKRILPIFMLLLAVLASYIVVARNHIELSMFLVDNRVYFVAEMLGNYLLGLLIGFAIANSIQRVRGEHNHVN